VGILYTILKKHNSKKTFKDLYKKVFIKYKVLIKIISDKDRKFILRLYQIKIESLY
jgi:hypothetical protein